MIIGEQRKHITQIDRPMYASYFNKQNLLICI